MCDDDLNLQIALADLRRPDLTARRGAIAALSAMGAVDALIETLRDNEHWFIRMMAAQALGHLRAVAAVPILVESLYATHDEWMQFDIVLALLEIGTPDALDAVRSWKQTAKNSILGGNGD